MNLDDESIVDGEVVASFEDETFMNLPPVPEEDGNNDGIRQPEIDSSRRDFVIRVALGGAAALALGGSAALLYNQQRRSDRTTEVVVPFGSQSGGAASVNSDALARQVADLEGQIAAIMAERDQAISDLNAASTQVADLQAQLSDARTRLEDAETVNSLWQALDDIGLDGLLDSAMQTVATVLATVVSVLTVFQAGLLQGQTTIDTFVKSLPGPSDGIRWLQQRLTALAADIEWLTEQVQQAVEPVEPFATLIAQFVLWVLDRLPFGAGDKARAGLEAMQTVLNSLPAMIDGINNDVMNPLAEWFGSDIQVNLEGTLVTPIKNKVFTTGGSLAKQVTDLKDTYETVLAAPAQTSLSQRAELRTQIQSVQVRISGYSS